jgi:hypothetical protein
MKSKKKRDDEVVPSIDALSWDISSSRTILSDKHVGDCRNVEGLPAGRFSDPPDRRRQTPQATSHRKRWTVKRPACAPSLLDAGSRSPGLKFCCSQRRPTRWPFGNAVRVAFDVACVLPIFPPFEAGGHATNPEPTALGRRSCRGATISPHAACARSQASQASQHGWSKKRQP